MAGDDEQAEPRSANGDERRAFVRFLALVAAAAGTLVLGAVLQGPAAPPTPPPRAPSGEPAALPSAADAGLVPPDQAPARLIEPPAEGPKHGLAERVDADVSRAATDRAGFTLQLLVACDPANVERLLREHGDDPELLLFPVQHGERDCYRVCWGRFASKDEAADARAPAGFGSEVGKPRRIAELLP